MSKELCDKASEVETTYINLKGRLTSMRETILSEEQVVIRDENKHKELLHLYEVNCRSIEVMKKLVGLLSERGLQKLKDMLTYGLSTIFEDRNYSIDIEIAERGDAKTAEFYLVENIGSVSRRVRVRDSIGDGVVTLISFVLRIYFCSVLGLRRVIFLDEALSSVSEKYVEPLFGFIKQLIEDLGYTFILVTHDSRFTEYADRLYEIQMGKPKLIRG